MTKYNKSEIMKEAHRLYKSNNRFGWSFGKSLSVAWSNAKQRIINLEVEAKNEAIRQLWRAEAEAKRQADRQAENERFVASGMDLHTYSMSQYYKRGSSVYYGD